MRRWMVVGIAVVLLATMAFGLSQRGSGTTAPSPTPCVNNVDACAGLVVP